MQESLEPPPNLTSNDRQARVSTFSTALVHVLAAHRKVAGVGVDIIEAVDVVAEASTSSSSTTPEAPAQPHH